MTRFTIAICTWWFGVAGIAVAQSPFNGADGKSLPVRTVAAPPSRSGEILPPLPSPTTPGGSPGDAQISREARAHEQYLLQSQAQAESVHRAAVARAEQRTRRLESQRWFGISNTRPTASVDPIDGDYSAGWVPTIRSIRFAGWEAASPGASSEGSGEDPVVMRNDRSTRGSSRPALLAWRRADRRLHAQRNRRALPPSW